MAHTTESFIEKSNIIHNNKYDYSLVLYKRIDIPVIITCPIHGQFPQTPKIHIINKCGCPKCGVAAQKQTMIDKYGIIHPSQSHIFKETWKQTILTKYGVDNPSKDPITKNKVKQTNLKKYGVNNPQQSQIIKDKKANTCLEKYGVTNVLNSDYVKNLMIIKYNVPHPQQSAEIRYKTIQTNLIKYGTEHPWSNQDIRAKINQTNIEKYGIKNNKQQHMVDILSLLQDPDWLFDQYINQNKTAWHIAQELGIGDTTIGKYLKKAEIEIKKYQQSFISKLWLQSIQEQEQIEIIYEYQWDKNNLRTRSDGFCKETNTIYEFHGNYWHGNPEIYSPEEIHPIIKKSMGELYRKTIEREERIKSLGYNLVIIWERDFKYE